MGDSESPRDESKVPGAVPALDGLIKPYTGQPMGPFTEADKLPFISEMLSGGFGSI